MGVPLPDHRLSTPGLAMSILATVDFSDASRAALRHAAREARCRDRALTVLHCLEARSTGTGLWSWLSGDDPEPETLRDRGRARLDDVVRATLDPSERPDDWTTRILVDSASEGIVSVLDEHACELVVMGATGRGRLEQFLIGGTTEQVVRSSPIPVLVVPDGVPAAPYERILSPVDFSECARLGLERATELAERDGAELLVLHHAHVASSGPGRPDMAPAREVVDRYRQDVDGKLDAWLKELETDAERYRKLLRVHAYDRHDPAEAIVESARDHDVDLVVMGTHGRRGVERLFLGSTTYKVLHRMPAPVLTVRRLPVERGGESGAQDSSSD
jgi:nucleotide-binding universal stress UspA family protein